MPKKKNNINKTLAITLIFSGAVLILLAFVLMRVENILGWIGSFLGIMRPIFIGIALTFILYGPVVKTTKFLEKVTKGKRFPCNGVAVLLSYVFFIGILIGLIWIVVPSFINSIEEFAGKFSIYMINIQNSLENVIRFINGNGSTNFLENFNINTKDIISQISSVVSKLPDHIPDIMEKVGSWASGFAGVLTDIGFGLAFSIYMLIGRSKLKGQAKRIVKTFFSQSSYERISHYSSLIFNTFSNFVSGQLMEALILGLLCFIGMTILGFPYAIMISVIIGVTNIIPIIGPIIGTIPGVVIYLMIDPWKAVWFVVFIIVLQQIDSNLIYPRVVGSSVGLPAIWILFAITIGSGLFGIIGMIIGVPVMSLIYTILREKTAAAAEKNDKENIEKPPMFPAVNEKTTEIFSKVKSTVHNGLGNIIDKIDDRIHKKEKHKDKEIKNNNNDINDDSNKSNPAKPEDTIKDEIDTKKLNEEELIDKVLEELDKSEETQE